MIQVQQPSMASMTAVPADASALDTEAVYREHAATVARCLRRLGVRPEDRDDVLQDVFVVVHRGRARFEGRSSVGTWVYGIAVRVAIAHLRRTRGRAERARVEPASAPPHEPDPQGALEQRDAATVLDGLLAELDDDKRAVFVLSELEDVPVPRIAEALALNVRTTYSRLRAARADFERGWVRWQARAARIERRVPVRELGQRSGDERVPAWSVIAMGLNGIGQVPVATVVGASAIAWTTWAGIGAAAIIAAIAAGAAISRAPADTATTQRAAQVQGERSPTPSNPRPPNAPNSATTDAPHAPTVDAPTADIRATDTPVVARTHEVTPRATRPPVNVPAPPDDAPPTATREPLALLRDARAALRRGDAVAAIIALREHERLAPSSELAIERETLWVEAACASGDREAAGKHADRWAAHTSDDAQTLLNERCPPR